MSNIQANHLGKAAQHWNSNEALDAGRLIFESLPNSKRASWAIDFLGFMVRRLKLELQEAQRVLTLAEHPQDWPKAHSVFDLVRDATLELESLTTRSREQELQLALLGLAELVAKIIYNSIDPPDEFDEDSGWWIAVCARQIVDLVNDELFRDEVWQELIRER